jgi:hypothetical protein
MTIALLLLSFISPPFINREVHDHTSVHNMKRFWKLRRCKETFNILKNNHQMKIQFESRRRLADYARFIVQSRPVYVKLQQFKNHQILSRILFIKCLCFWKIWRYCSYLKRWKQYIRIRIEKRKHLHEVRLQHRNNLYQDACRGILQHVSNQICMQKRTKRQKLMRQIVSHWRMFTLHRRLGAKVLDSVNRLLCDNESFSRPIMSSLENQENTAVSSFNSLRTLWTSDGSENLARAKPRRLPVDSDLRYRSFDVVGSRSFLNESSGLHEEKSVLPSCESCVDVMNQERRPRILNQINNALADNNESEAVIDSR